MSVDTIDPSAIHPPIQTGRQRFYETYNTRDVPIGGEDPTGGGFHVVSNTRQVFVRMPGGGNTVQTPSFLPKFLGSRALILFAWAAAMALVSADEWKTYHILPRPARLWDTSLMFFLIAGASSFDALVPICTIFAIGMVISLAYNYYQGTGQFTSADTSASGDAIA
jgi:hypothetical protein